MMQGLIRFLPGRFDLNEWFICSVSCLLIILIWLMHKYFRPLTSVELIFTVLFNQCFSGLDHLLAMPPFDFYDTGDKPYPASDDLLLHLVMYPGLVCIALAVYKLLHLKNVWLIVFIIGCASITTALDWVSEAYLHVITYKSWRPIYSFIFYNFVFAVNIYAMLKVHRIVERPKEGDDH